MRTQPKGKTLHEKGIGKDEKRVLLISRKDAIAVAVSI